MTRRPPVTPIQKAVIRYLFGLEGNWIAGILFIMFIMVLVVSNYIRSLRSLKQVRENIEGS